MRLKGVYKYPGWNDQLHFGDWLARTNPTVGNPEGAKVSVSMKHGKRRKLKTMIVEYRQSGCGDPACCGGFKELHLAFPQKTPA